MVGGSLGLLLVSWMMSWVLHLSLVLMSRQMPSHGEACGVENKVRKIENQNFLIGKQKPTVNFEATARALVAAGLF